MNKQRGNAMIEYRHPKDTDTELYISTYSTVTLDNLIDQIKDHFNIDSDKFDKVTISAEKIQICCFGYDQYDPNDYEDYIVVNYKKE